VRIIEIDITLHVPSLEKTMAWYKDVLGWDAGCDLENEAGECLYGDVFYAHDPLVGFNLSKAGADIKPSGFHPLIKVPDVEGLFQTIRDKDVCVVQAPQTQPWGVNCKIRDINGYVLEFWSELGG
jgi:predicted enzyme related to lactoylglutathione lyase